MSKSDGGRSAGKGSSPRPFSVAQAEYEARWDMIFGRDKPKEQEKPEEQPKETEDE